MVSTILVIASACAVAFAAYFAWSFFKGSPLSVRNLFSRAMLKFLFKNPETLTMLGMLDSLGIHGHNGKWGRNDFARQEELLDDLGRELGYLKTWDRSRMNPVMRVSSDNFEWFMEDQLASRRFLRHGYQVTQMFGPHSNMVDMMTQMQPVDCRANAINFAKRLEAFPERFDELVANLREAESAGVRPPRFALEKAIEQMRKQIEDAPRDNPMFRVFADKLAKVKASPGFKRAAEARVAKALEERVYPAYRDLVAACEDLLSRCDSNDGVWRLPDGDEYYRACLASSTTLKASPEEIHAKGVAETARIETEIAALLDRLGIPPEESVGARIASLGSRERFFYPQSEEGRAAILADFRSIVDGMYARLPEVFEKLPRTKVEIAPVPADREKDSPGGYYQPGTLDGKRPGRFFVNLYDMKKNPKYGMKTLCYHETVPGHHLQLSLQFEMRGMPLFMRVVPTTAYVEGWALYAERLAREMGFYSGDDEGLLGSLLAEHFRAIRLVVDTGLHAMRWSREKAIEYMREHTGDGNEVEVERYLVMPGQACAYKVGELAIRELRAKAERELGAAFDLKAFHSMLLGYGALPLDLLRRRADEWIAGRALAA